MKNYLPFLLGLFLIFSSCITDATDIMEENEILEKNSDTTLTSRFNENTNEDQIVGNFFEAPEPPIELISNEFIVEYADNVTQQRKDLIRQQYKVKSYKSCDCTVNSDKYELWTMKEGVTLEPSTIVIDDDDDAELQGVSRNFSYAMPISSQAPGNESDEPHIESTFNTLYLNKIKAINDGITIAVLDSGIDVDSPGFSGDFLYNAAGNGQCNEESGWDFVNSDSNPYDDYPEIHGTVVSYIIHNELTKKAIKHQILPVKVADANGKATAFNTLCGMIYAIEKGASVINMSLGWYNSSTYTYDVFSGIIDLAASNNFNSVENMFVTSAGNSDNNNDTNPHYPSGFPQYNVLAIAAAIETLQGAADYSNFGFNSVDFYAKGNEVAFPLYPLNNINRYYYFFGTSFAAPLVSARIAEMISNNIAHDQLRNKLSIQFGNSISCGSKPVLYNELIK